jgi:serine/threonine protein kinase
MATHHTLAYFAAPELLPAPLPTVAEILESTRFLVRYGEALVVRVSDHFVVKYGKKVNLREAEHMLFVREHTGVPLPAVYAFFHDENTGQSFIIQEYVAGKPLDLVWDTLCHDEKMAMTCQLRQNIEELRGIPPPGYGYYGGHRLVFTHGELFPGNMIFREDTKTVVIINWGRSGWYPSSWEYCCAMRLAQYRYDWAQWVPVVLAEYFAELGWMQSRREVVFPSYGSVPSWTA